MNISRAGQLCLTSVLQSLRPSCLIPNPQGQFLPGHVTSIFCLLLRLLQVHVWLVERERSSFSTIPSSACFSSQKALINKAWISQHSVYTVEWVHMQENINAGLNIVMSSLAFPFFLMLISLFSMTYLTAAEFIFPFLLSFPTVCRKPLLYKNKKILWLLKINLVTKLF